jgi:NAD(P)-dependent dehydrogenase (short-subunit alcohol dehydrogenase family)
MDLTNASAIVTGGAGGFGSATVRRLAQMGARVVIADVSDERGEALAREVGAGSLSRAGRLHGRRRHRQGG